MAVVVGAVGLVKAAREWFRLQVVRVLMASGAFCCRWARAWLGRGALAAPRASTAACQYRCIIG